jgi:hypothetical protein
MKVADDRLRKVLGLSRMSFRALNSPIAITDMPLEADSGSAGGHEVVIDNFSFRSGGGFRTGRRDGSLDESRRRASRHHEHREEVQVARHGHR